MCLFILREAEHRGRNAAATDQAHTINPHGNIGNNNIRNNITNNNNNISNN